MIRRFLKIILNLSFLIQEPTLDKKILDTGHIVHPINTRYPDCIYPDNYFFKMGK